MKEPKPKPTPKRVAASSSGRVVLSIPISIHERMRQQRHLTGDTYAAQILNSLEANADRLQELVQASKPRTTRGALFERVEAPAGRGPAKTHVTVQGISASHVTIIDELVETTGAGSRSALITLALGEWLPK